MKRRSPAFIGGRRKSKGLPKADWVYRQHGIRTDTGVQVDSLGTYDEVQVILPSGVQNAQSHILYDSHVQIGMQTAAGTQTPAGTPIRYVNRAARAEGSRATILRTQGIIVVQPDGWVLGNVIALGWRIGAWEQDTTGVFTLDAAYSMWVRQVATPFDPPAMWANFHRLNAREGRVFREFNSTQVSPLFPVYINWRGRRRLDPKDCWGIYTEGAPTSIQIRQQFWLRTLVVDEG